MRFCYFGDSISVHYGPYLETYLCGSAAGSRMEGAAEALSNLDTPQGTNTGDSSMLLAFFKNKAESGGIDSDLLLFNCGLHDIKTDPVTGAKQIPLPQYRENLKAILGVLAGMKPRPVWIRTTPCDEAVHNHAGSTFLRFSADGVAYNQAADQIMAEAGIPVIDLYTFTLNLGSELYCDHVHFHEHIREKQAAYLAGWLAAFVLKA
ncbi:MAG: SGNH/GDSL hydrolase family protein [bacterium]